MRWRHRGRHIFIQTSRWKAALLDQLNTSNTVEAIIRTKMAYVTSREFYLQLLLPYARGVGNDVIAIAAMMCSCRLCRCDRPHAYSPPNLYKYFLLRKQLAFHANVTVHDRWLEEGPTKRINSVNLLAKVSSIGALNYNSATTDAIPSTKSANFTALPRPITGRYVISELVYNSGTRAGKLRTEPTIWRLCRHVTTPRSIADVDGAVVAIKQRVRVDKI